MSSLRTPPGWQSAGEPAPLGIAGRREEQWHMGKLGGAVVAIAKTMEFTVTADGSEEVVLGLGGVSVNPNYQRRGFGAAVVGAAFARADLEGKRMVFQTGDALPLCKHHHPQPSRTPPALATQLHATRSGPLDHRQCPLDPTHRGSCRHIADESLGAKAVDKSLALNSADEAAETAYPDYHFVVYPAASAPDAPIDHHGVGW